MTLRIIHRPARTTVPLKPGAEEPVAPPPALTDAPLGGFPIQTLLPVLGAGTSVVVMVVLRGNQMFMLLGAAILIVAVVGGLGMALTQRGNASPDDLAKAFRLTGHFLDMHVWHPRQLPPPSTRAALIEILSRDEH